ncbi:MAG: CoA transferase [Chloroflexi bacterium]|nr:CoA transferase [Chloroflexota bacterium]
MPPDGGPLEGLRVLDLTDDHAGALTTMFLADYGADVVKVVPSAGLPLERGPGYLIWNRNKRALASGGTDGGSSQDGAVFRLAREADVLVESFRPDSHPPCFDYEGLRKVNEGIVWCSITPYGPSGPLSSHPGYEGLVAAASGIMTEQRGPNGAPVYNALPIAGIGTALLAIHGILAASHRRAVAGRGQRVDTSMYQGALAARSPMLVRGEGVQTWDSAGNDPQGALPNYRLYRCADDKWLHLGTLIPVFWNKLIIALDLYQFATDPRFETAPLYWPTEEIRAEAKRILADKFASATRDHWLKVLREGDVPVSPATPTHELFEHPQVAANGMSTAIEDPRVGRLEQGMPPVALSLTPGAVRRPAPAKAAANISWESPIRFHARLPSGTKPASSAKAGKISAAGPRPGRGPLAGIRVLDLSSYLAGPIGPAYLADLGADVIKVEPRGGEGCRMIMMLFLGGNPSKRGLALDLKSPASKEVLRRLIKRSDVVVHNNRVGVAERLGIDYESVRRIRPDVIYLQSTAYGSKGPDAALPGFDPLFQSLSGIGMAQAGPGRPPVFPKTPSCDIATAMLGAAAVLLGLAHRDRTGEGQLIETSLLATGLWLRCDAFVRYGGSAPPRVTNEDNSGTGAVYRWYRAADGYLFVACRTEAQAAALCKAAGVLPAETTDETGGTAREMAIATPGSDGDVKLTAKLAAAIARRSVAEWLDAFGKSGVPSERVAENNDEGVHRNPQARHLRALAQDRYPGFKNLVQPGILVRFSDTPAVRRSAPPVCGEHTVEVLTELGYSGEEISKLEASGAIGIHRAGQS